jgi:putative SOS response-associated peptidase YedK
MIQSAVCAVLPTIGGLCSIAGAALHLIADDLCAVYPDERQARDPKIAYSTINARAEDIAEKPVYRKPIRSQRCLVPADGFYEWKRLTLEGKEEKFPWYIGLKDRSLFAFAGLWDTWKDAEGVEILRYSIITTTPNTLMESIHDRMPVILHQKDVETWLDNETPLTTVLSLLKPYPAAEMLSFPVSTRVNSPRNDDPNLLLRVNG